MAEPTNPDKPTDNTSVAEIPTDRGYPNRVYQPVGRRVRDVCGGDGANSSAPHHPTQTYPTQHTARKGEKMKKEISKWQVLVKWTDSDDGFINMVVRNRDEGQRSKRFHVTWITKENRFAKGHDNEGFFNSDDAVEEAMRVAKEVELAKRMLEA